MVSDITAVKRMRMLARFSGTSIAAVPITDSPRTVLAAQCLPDVESSQCGAYCDKHGGIPQHVPK
jgi:hypothetical protein